MVMSSGGGAAFIATVQRPGDDLQLVLRDGQQISARVLGIEKNQVTISVNGVKITAQLSGENVGQLKTLLQNNTWAKFLVQNVTKNTVQLQLAPQAVRSPGTPPPATATATTAGLTGNTIVNLPQMASGILEEVGLAQNSENLSLAQALLSRGIKITGEKITNLSETLSQIKNWGKNEMNTAISVQEAGLPLTPETVKLFSQGVPEISKSLTQLRTELNQLLKSQDLPPQAAALAKEVVTQVNNFFLNVQSSSKEIKEGLQNILQMFGRTLERDLANLVMQGENSLPSRPTESMLMNLANLRVNIAKMLQQSSGGQSARMLSAQAKSMMNEVLQTIDQTIEQMRSLQFFNLPSNTEPAHGQWIRLDLPVRQGAKGTYAERKSNEDIHTTQLRVAYRQGGGSNREIDPNYTRLIIQADVAEGELMIVDLSIASRKIGANIITSNEDWLSVAESELPGFEAALGEVGFHLETSRFQVDRALSSGESDQTDGSDDDFGGWRLIDEESAGWDVEV